MTKRSLFTELSEGFEALRLAECLERDCDMNWPDYDNQMNSAKELRRLHAENQELRMDAERYRSLIVHQDYDGFGYWLPEIFLTEGSVPATKEQFDRAFDKHIFILGKD